MSSCWEYQLHRLLHWCHWIEELAPTFAKDLPFQFAEKDIRQKVRNVHLARQLMHEMIWGDSIRGQMGFIRTIFVAASERSLSVHRQFCTSLWLWCPRCIASACIPPGKVIILIIHIAIFSCSNSVTVPFNIYLYFKFFVFCIVPASTMAGLLLEQTDRTFSTRDVVQSSFS